MFRSQRYAVLATDDHGQPFTSLMAFAATEDLRQIVILTERARRKFSNLKANCRVALLIDDRKNKGTDAKDSVAVTAIGEAREAGEQRLVLHHVQLTRRRALHYSSFSSLATQIWRPSLALHPAPSSR